MSEPEKTDPTPEEEAANRLALLEIFAIPYLDNWKKCLPVCVYDYDGTATQSETDEGDDD